MRHLSVSKVTTNYFSSSDLCLLSANYPYEGVMGVLRGCWRVLCWCQPKHTQVSSSWVTLAQIQWPSIAVISSFEDWTLAETQQSLTFLSQLPCLTIKGKFLNSAVSSPQDHSKRFTIYFPDRPVHSDTISASLGSIQPYATINARKLLVHISITVYCQVLINTPEWTAASSEKTCPWLYSVCPPLPTEQTFRK